jgi:hypothetical protein
LSDGHCRNCGKKIEIQIRLGGESCSLDCDRELGIGKYAEQAGPYPHPAMVHRGEVVLNQTIINVEKKKRKK